MCGAYQVNHWIRALISFIIGFGSLEFCFVYVGLVSKKFDLSGTENSLLESFVSFPSFFEKELLDPTVMYRVYSFRSIGQLL